MSFFQIVRQVVGTNLEKHEIFLPNEVPGAVDQTSKYINHNFCAANEVFVVYECDFGYLQDRIEIEQRGRYHEDDGGA